MTVTSSDLSRNQSSRGICVIMAGGRGTRFWPLSRTHMPKQLLPLGGSKSLLRETYERVEPLVGADRILVITSGSLAAPTRDQLPELPQQNIITEPVGRNTAPCAVLGMAIASRIDPEAPVALLPADHFIPDQKIFRQQLAEAFTLVARQETVVTFGIRPNRPETGYGYIETEDKAHDEGFRHGLRFVEKPDVQTATEYMTSGRFFWNSGIFIWNPAFFAATSEKYVPLINDLMDPVAHSFGTDAFTLALEKAYGACPADSIDYAVMEKLPGFTLTEARYTWSDLGSWDSWGELAPEMGNGNRGKGQVVALDSSDNIIMGAEGRTIAMVGVQDLIVVDTPDALLVCRKADAQRIKEVISLLEKDGRDNLL